MGHCHCAALRPFLIHRSSVTCQDPFSIRCRCPSFPTQDRWDGVVGGVQLNASILSVVWGSDPWFLAEMLQGGAAGMWG